MLGDDDIGVLIDEPVTAADLFGEDEDETHALDIPPLSPNPDDDENTAPATGDAGDSDAKVKKRRQLNRLPNLNEKWITDPNKAGMHSVNIYFEKIKLKRGKGNELCNIKMILKRYEYWAQQCYPKLCFKDFVDKVESLSHKKLVKNVLQEIRCSRSSGDINDDNNDDNACENAEGDAGGDVQTRDFLNTPAPFASPAVQPNTSFASPHLNSTSFASPQLNSTVTDEQREAIRRKREEAIAKRERKLEEIMNQSNLSLIQQGKNDISSILDSSLVSMSDNISLPLNPTHDSISQVEMEVSKGNDLKDIIRRKRVQAFINDQHNETLDESHNKTVPVEHSKSVELQSHKSQNPCISMSEPNVAHLEHAPTSISEMSDWKTTHFRDDSSMTVLDVEKLLNVDDITLRGSSIEEPSDIKLKPISVNDMDNQEVESKKESDGEPMSSIEKEMDIDG